MKKYLILFFLLLFGFKHSYGQFTFQKVIYTSSGCYGWAVQQTTDGGFIIIGHTVNSDDLPDGVYLIKTDERGDTLWTKIFGGHFDTWGTSVQQTTDGGYIVAGTLGDSNLIGHLYVIKTNAFGDSLWTKTIGGDSNNVASSIQQTIDGGYIITGSTQSFGAGYDDVYLVKINASGDITWTKTYGGIGGDYGACVKQTTDSGYIIAGSTFSFGAGNEDVYLIKTKANGDTLWTKTYGGIYEEGGNSIQQTTDGGYIITGFTESFGAGMSNVYLIKTDDFGDTLWTKTYGETDYWGGALAVQQTYDGSYIIVGGMINLVNYSENVYLTKTNVNGDTIWTKTYGGSYFEEGSSVWQTIDGGYVIAGISYSFPPPNVIGGVYLIKTDANGKSGCYESNMKSTASSTATKVGSTQTIVSSGGSTRPTTTIIHSDGIDSTLCMAFIVKPESDFLASDSTLCENDCINFINLTNNATSYQWLFSGSLDSTSTASNPQHICYSKAGKFDVKLVASNAGGSDTLTLYNYITVYPNPPIPVITHSHDTLFSSTDSSYHSYQWYDSTILITSATDTFLVISHAGNYNVKVTTNYGCDIAGGIIVTGVREFTVSGLQFTVYPNPAGDELRISPARPGEELRIKKIEIYNVLGQMNTHPAPLHLDMGDAMVDISDLPSGIYFVQITTEKARWVGRFVKE